MSLTQQEQEMVAADLKVPGTSMSKIARRLGLTYPELRAHLQPAPSVVVNTTSIGAEALRPYIVAARHSWSPWDNDGEAIQTARRAYNAGTHEMFQGRDGDVFILYSKPRRTRARPRGYFE